MDWMGDGRLEEKEIEDECNGGMIREDGEGRKEEESSRHRQAVKLAIE